MRNLHTIEQCRIRTGPLASSSVDGMNGAFLVWSSRDAQLTILSSDGKSWEEDGMDGVAWEHVSVSTKSRCPTWDEMAAVKKLFWRDDEMVIQLHLPLAEHVNIHPYCLHLWRPIGVEILKPPAETLHGMRGVG